VKEQPYDATSDLWSLGVILFELYVGQPPFYTNSIYSLINHIVKDPVKYPTEISREFKSFLQGLLQKNPSRRLTWPHLLDHPFVRETEADRDHSRQERTHYAACGGQGGPRARLESIMGADTDKESMFGTMNIRKELITGLGSAADGRGMDSTYLQLPHAVAKKRRAAEQREQQGELRERAARRKAEIDHEQYESQLAAAAAYSAYNEQSYAEGKDSRQHRHEDKAGGRDAEHARTAASGQTQTQGQGYGPGPASPTSMFTRALDSHLRAETETDRDRDREAAASSSSAASPRRARAGRGSRASKDDDSFERDQACSHTVAVAVAASATATADAAGAASSSLRSSAVSISTRSAETPRVNNLSGASGPYDADDNSASVSVSVESDDRYMSAAAPAAAAAPAVSRVSNSISEMYADNTFCVDEQEQEAISYWQQSLAGLQAGRERDAPLTAALNIFSSEAFAANFDAMVTSIAALTADLTRFKRRDLVASMEHAHTAKVAMTVFRTAAEGAVASLRAATLGAVQDDARALLGAITSRLTALCAVGSGVYKLLVASWYENAVAGSEHSVDEDAVADVWCTALTRVIDLLGTLALPLPSSIDNDNDALAAAAGRPRQLAKQKHRWLLPVAVLWSFSSLVADVLGSASFISDIAESGTGVAEENTLRIHLNLICATAKALNASLLARSPYASDVASDRPRSMELVGLLVAQRMPAQLVACLDLPYPLERSFDPAWKSAHAFVAAVQDEVAVALGRLAGLCTVAGFSTHRTLRGGMPLQLVLKGSGKVSPSAEDMGGAEAGQPALDGVHALMPKHRRICLEIAEQLCGSAVSEAAGHSGSSSRPLRRLLTQVVDAFSGMGGLRSQSQSQRSSGDGLGATSGDGGPAEDSIEGSLLCVLAHVTSAIHAGAEPRAHICRALVLFEDGRLLATLQEVVQLPVHSLSKTLALLVLSNCMRFCDPIVLTPTVAARIVTAALSCLGEQATSDSPWQVELMSASCACLQSAAAFSVRATTLSTHAERTRNGTPAQTNVMLNMISQALLPSGRATSSSGNGGSNGAALRSVVKLLSYSDLDHHFENSSSSSSSSGRSDAQSASRLLAFTAIAITHADGNDDDQFASLAGVFDSALSLLAGLADQSPAFLRGLGPHRLSIFEVVCRQLQSAGCGEISPPGVARALHLLSAICWSGAPKQSLDGSRARQASEEGEGEGEGDQAGAPSSSDDPRGHVRSMLHLAHREGLAGLLTVICLPQHVALCREWGADAVNDLVVAVCDVLRCLLSFISSPLSASMAVGASAAASSSDHRPQSPAAGKGGAVTPSSSTAGSTETHSQKILEGVYRTQLVGCLVQVLKLHHATASDSDRDRDRDRSPHGVSSTLSVKAMAVVVHVLCELVLTSSKFMAQFVESRGLEAIVDLPCFARDERRKSGARLSSSGERNAHGEQQIVVCLLQISSHLARHSEKHFDVLCAVFGPERLVSLLSQRNASARAKCCNLIGNLCRHSSRFYPILRAPVRPDADAINYMHGNAATSPLVLLTACCADEDAGTRKFACFAVGNAAFHSAELYDALSHSIPPLARAAEVESDEKTRANAVGAIGNLVRNGGALARAMVAERVPLQLLKTVLIETDVATQRIALFSLGTMSVYPSCRDCLSAATGPSVAEVVKIVKDTSRDETVLKYLARFRQKLKQPVVEA
jgi:hypothetical protein